jgi:hypothetical protein
MTSNSQTAVVEEGILHVTSVKIFLTIVIVTTLAVLLLYRLNSYPTPSLDESAYLQVAKNFGLHGLYAATNLNGEQFPGPVIGTGPTVILPIALLFRLFGPSVVLGRVVIVIYSILTLVMLYLFGEKVVGKRMAILAVLSIFFSQALEYPYLSRMVMGEVPGLFFIICGIYLWIQEQVSIPQLVLIGVMFGCASITKNQYALFVLPSILILWIADIVYYRRHKWTHFVIPGIIAGVMFAGWTYYVLYILGGPHNFVGELRKTTSIAFFNIDFDTLSQVTHYLLNWEIYGAMLLPSLLYGLLISLRRDSKGLMWGTIFTFTLLGFGVFVASSGTARYAFAPITLASVFFAGLMHYLTNGLNMDMRSFRDVINGREVSLQTILSLVVIGILFGTLVFPTLTRVKRNLREGDNYVYLVADYINVNIPKDAVIETWQKELAVLTDNRYHFPTQEAEVALAKLYLYDPGCQAESPVSEVYDFRKYVTPEYIVLGPISQCSGAYTEENLASYDLLTSIGTYNIYKLH